MKGKKIKYNAGDIIGCLVYKGDHNELTKEKGARYAYFECRCGVVFSSKIASARTGHTTSCGCWFKHVRKSFFIKHGHSVGGKFSLEYSVWKSLKGRCLNPSNKKYPIYGGVGISICPDWVNSFETFLKDMGERPSKKHSLDRIDNSKGYSKENCRWATSKEQNRNQSKTIMVEYMGSVKALRDWCDELSLDANLMYNRIVRAKWDVDRSFRTPVAKKNFKKNNIICQQQQL